MTIAWVIAVPSKNGSTAQLPESCRLSEARHLGLNGLRVIELLVVVLSGRARELLL